MLSAGLGLILLPWILLLRHRPSLHRGLGRVGAGLLLVGAATSLPSALLSEAGPVARLGFFTQGALCLVFLVGGVRAIWMHDRQRHVRMMTRVSALVLGAIVLRALLAAAMSLGWPFEATYTAIAWLVPSADAGHALANRLHRPAPVPVASTHTVRKRARIVSSSARKTAGLAL
jgi:hypothetical protein